MRYYFDQRESEKVNVFIYIDDTYYGKIYAKEQCITSVDLPDNTKRIQLSFSDAYNSIEKVKTNTTTDSWTYYELDNEKEETEEEDTEVAVEKELDPDLLQSMEHKEMTFGYEDSVKIPYDDMSNRRWQFPYDVEIDTSAYPGDLVFYPAKFERKELEGGIYYQGRTVEACNLIEMKLKKRIYILDTDTWRTLYLIIGAVVFIACAVLLVYSLTFYTTEYLPNRDYYDAIASRMDRKWLSRIIVGFCGIIGSIVVFFNNLHYKGMYVEKDMKAEYFVNSEGEVTEI